MRIFWVSHVGGDSLGGAERSLVESVAGLRERGVEATVVVPSAGRLASMLEDAGGSVVVLPHVWWAWAGRRPAAWRIRRRAAAVFHSAGPYRKLAALLRQEKPDLVVTNTLAVPVGALAARSARIPHVWYVHEFGREDHRLGFLLGERMTLRLVDRLSRIVIVNSLAVREKYERLGLGARLHLVYYAVEAPSTPPAPAERRAELELVQVGMLSSHKGQADALRAVGVLAAKGIDVRLRLVGSQAGELYARVLDDLLDELDIRNRVDFVGFADDPAPYFAAADVALMCSRNEAFGRVTVEAMNVGTPVVGARSGGTVELVDEGRRGLLYTPGDADELATRLETLYRDGELRRRLGTEAQAWALETFTRERHTDELLRAFERALSPPAS